jgi:hypothetical protein
MTDRDDPPDLEFTPSVRTWVLGAISLAFAALTLAGEPIPLVTGGWLLMGAYFTMRAARGRLFVADETLWQRGAFTEKRLLAFTDLDHVSTYATWPLKKTVVLSQGEGKRVIIRLVEWRNVTPLLRLIRSVATNGGRTLDPVTEEWFADRLDEGR